MVGVRLSVFDIPPFKTSREVGEPMDYAAAAAVRLGLWRRRGQPAGIRPGEPLQLIGACGSWAWRPSISPAAVPTTIRTSSGRPSFRPATAICRPRIPLVGVVAADPGGAGSASRLFPTCRWWAPGYTYLQDYLPHVAQAVVAQWLDRSGGPGADGAGLPRAAGRLAGRPAAAAKTDLPHVQRLHDRPAQRPGLRLLIRSIPTTSRCRKRSSSEQSSGTSKDVDLGSSPLATGATGTLFVPSDGGPV